MSTAARPRRLANRAPTPQQPPPRAQSAVPMCPSPSSPRPPLPPARAARSRPAGPGRRRRAPVRRPQPAPRSPHSTARLAARPRRCASASLCRQRLLHAPRRPSAAACVLHRPATLHRPPGHRKSRPSWPAPGAPRRLVAILRRYE
nr:vegetative cell wall protein gp1-like [Aegilops tauschii subsp. strangulata]